MSNDDIRWKQRFQNLENAFSFLSESLKKENLSRLEEAGIIQSFEFTFELAWNTLKDYLEMKSVPAKYPRDVIQEAFRYEMILDGETWMDMLEKRNLLSHNYDEKKSALALKLIREKYFIALQQAFNWLKEKNK